MIKPLYKTAKTITVSLLQVIVLFILGTLSFASYSQTFTEVSQASGINYLSITANSMGGGVSIFDFDNDGFEDIYITGGTQRDRLYHNKGNGQFEEVGIAAGLGITGSYFTFGVVTGDIDNDGFRDIFVTTWGSNTIINLQSFLPCLLFKNNGNGTFLDISATAGITHAAWSFGASFGDYNLDGWLDILVGNHVDNVAYIYNGSQVVGYDHDCFPNFLYVNNRDGTFTEKAAALGVNNNGCTLAITFTDCDNDHDLDIYTVNDYGGWIVANTLYRNEYPVDSFTDVSVSSNSNAGIYGMGIAVGDYNEDGNLDYYVTNLGRNILYKNVNGIFQDVTDFAGVANTYTVDSNFSSGWGTAFLDYNNNSQLDLFVANGYILAEYFLPTNPKDPDKLYQNNGDGTFSDVSVLAGVSDSASARGFACGDYDNDGDMDMFVVNVSGNPNSSSRCRLYRNDLSNGKHWIKIRLQGVQSNRDGFGSRIEVKSNGRKWIREVDGGSSHASQNSSIAHFGLDTLTMVDTLLITWPGGGRQTLVNIPANHNIHIIQDSSSYFFSNQIVYMCNGDSLFAGGAYQTSAGIYRDFSIASNGMDSSVSSKIIINPSPTKIYEFLICEGDSFYYNGTYLTSSITFYESRSNPNGCDSSIITNFTLIPAVPPSVIPQYICAGDSFFTSGSYQTSSGIYTDTLYTLQGCDSIVLIDLSIIPSSFSNLLVSICDGDSVFIGGVFQMATGIYYDTLLSARGCDSVLIISLDIDSIDLSLTLEGNTLTANSSSINASFQWMNCNDGLISGATSQNFTPLTNGNYNVIVTENGCTDTSECIEILNTGILEVKEKDIKIYPNPVYNQLIIEISGLSTEQSTFSIQQLTGKSVLEKYLKTEKKQTIDVSELNDGIYFLVIRSQIRQVYFKFVKMH